MQDLKLIPYSNVNDSQFPQPIRLKVGKKDLDGIIFQDGKFTYSINNCLFSKLIIENDEEIDFKNISIAFTGCYLKEVEVKNILSKNISLIFLSSVFSGIIQTTNLNDVSINNCFANYIFLLGLNKVSITFTEENIYPLRWRVLLEKINLSKEKMLEIRQSYTIVNCKKVNVNGNDKGDKKPGFYRRHYEIISDYKIGYRLSPEEKKLLNINLSIKYEKEIEDSNIAINTLPLNSLTFSGAINGNITVENISTISWYLHDFFPKGEASFYNIHSRNGNDEESKIEFHKSNLDNTWFDNINFVDFSLISFYRTKFSKTIFTSCNFPENSISFEKFTSIENIHYPNEKRNSFYKDQYEIFLQLKMALETTGNFYESQKLFAISNDALKKISSISKWDKGILWINSNSNNHGISIKKPFFLFLGFSILFYVLYLFSLNRIFNSNRIDFTLIGYYFSFIDITHRNDFLVDKSEFNICSLTIDFANKIVAGFFIYQFIAAFRKYGKK